MASFQTQGTRLIRGVVNIVMVSFMPRMVMFRIKSYGSKIDESELYKV
jgi:hypothetical protein